MNNPDVQYSSAQIDMFENNIYNLRHILMYISQYITNSFTVHMQWMLLYKCSRYSRL